MHFGNLNSRQLHPRTRSYRSEPPSWNIEDSDPELIHRLLLQKSQMAKLKPLIIFDLDGTLFDVGFRTLGILKNWLSSSEASRFNSNVVSHVASIEFDHIGYSLAHAFENAGLDLGDQEVVDAFISAELFWRKKFFDGKTLVEFDQVMPGAQYFVQTLFDAGISIFYLTGRHHGTMLDGTLAQLLKFGFPCSKDQLVLKQNFGQDDHEFKAEAFECLSQNHEIIGNFENEYINIAAMANVEPKCVHVIVDSQHSGRVVPPLIPKIYRIEKFQR